MGCGLSFPLEKYRPGSEATATYCIEQLPIINFLICVLRLLQSYIIIVVISSTVFPSFLFWFPYCTLHWVYSFVCMYFFSYMYVYIYYLTSFFTEIWRSNQLLSRLWSNCQGFRTTGVHSPTSLPRAPHRTGRWEIALYESNNWEGFGKGSQKLPHCSTKYKATKYKGRQDDWYRVYLQAHWWLWRCPRDVHLDKSLKDTVPQIV